MHRSLPLVLTAALLAGCSNPADMRSDDHARAWSGSPVHLEEAKAEMRQEPNTEAYDRIVENDFLAVADAPLSTFSVDVDTASYSNVRRFLTDGSLPPADAVRIEELINYFEYDYEQPIGKHPFSVTAEVGDCPWADGHKLVLVGLEGKALDAAETPPRNLVFLLDVSGSMNDARKLPLVKRALQMLASNLDARDRVSIVVYAGASGVVLEPTAGSDQATIVSALDRLEAGGSTNGGEGIQLAYALARKSFVEGGINRVILATDGDFNVGVTSEGELTRLVEKERESGVYLSVLGFGTGNLKDSTMEKLADIGNGNYGYVDSLTEARKLLVEQAGGTLQTIAKDVKIQVEWNPAIVGSYRLIGYENRMLAAEDFNDDSKDAGDIGAGHTVTALYEVVPAGAAVVGAKVDPLRYQSEREPTAAANATEMAHVKLRYKAPESSASELLDHTIADRVDPASENLRFASAVAQFGMLLRGSAHKGASSFESVQSLAKGALGTDTHGHRREFVDLVARARDLSQARG
jgi:Ca-activated chloride channel family protein